MASLAAYVLDFAYTFTSCVACFPSPSLYINNRSYKIQRLLGEGGFSYVYLVQAQNGELFALKKIRCPFGAESLQVAMKEIDNYKIFHDEHIISMIDSNVVQERDGSKTVYILLPYFRRGNLQDTINANLINGSYYDEKEALLLFLDIARGVRVMHKHTLGGANGSSTGNSSRNSGVGMDIEAERPLMASEPADFQNAPQSLAAPGSAADTRIVAYAHRDIKPANIMLSQTGVPVLMDLGSCMRARIDVSSRGQALEIQDNAAEHCTMPYRAPELFDVKTNTILDEGVDIWSLGCTYFAMLYCSSPFELQTAETGASLSLAIINGTFRFPDAPKYSEPTKEIIRACLTVEPSQRPDIDKVISLIESSLAQFN
ncbi:kinase-like domain-containing protein [Myxozyma melibiosi]|uniref:non-specific serine/threonine protein kinase n=1 Tax=Myxozyma melibiosi TaxID=54550 RepID=A0ABR1F8B2_9ASCO